MAAISFFFPLTIWHASIGLGPSLSAGLKFSMQRPNESSQITQTTDRAGNSEACNCPKHVSQSPRLAWIHFLYRSELIATWENISVFNCRGCCSHVSFCFAPAQLEHAPLYFLLKKVTWGTMSRALLASSGSPWWGSAVIESGFLLPTEDNVSELSQIVYRIINSLHPNTCQLRSALTKTVYLIPPAVHLQPTRNGWCLALSHQSPDCIFSLCWMALKVMIGLIKIFIQLAMHCWLCFAG